MVSKLTKIQRRSSVQSARCECLNRPNPQFVVPGIATNFYKQTSVQRLLEYSAIKVASLAEVIT